MGDETMMEGSTNLLAFHDADLLVQRMKILLFII